MAEWDEHDIPADEDFFKVEKAKESNISPSAHQQRFEFSQIEEQENARESSLSGRLLLVMSTQKGIGESRVALGTVQAKSRDEVRARSGQIKGSLQISQGTLGDGDRKTAFARRVCWKAGVSPCICGRTPSASKPRFGIGRPPTSRVAAYTSFSNTVREVGGTCLSPCVIPEIAYHGVVVELPARGVDEILRNLRETKLIRSHEVMFFRPVGQCSFPLSDEEPRGEGGEGAGAFAARR